MKLKLNKDKIQVKEQQPAVATLSEESTEQGTPTEQGFSLSFSKDKTYNLDDIIFKKHSYKILALLQESPFVF